MITSPQYSNQVYHLSILVGLFLSILSVLMFICISYTKWLYMDFFRECLKLIPHPKFSFAKIWLLAAQFEIRQLNLDGARQILGNAIGRAPKDKVCTVQNFIRIAIKFYLYVHILTTIIFLDRYSKNTLKQSCSWEILIGAGSYMRNIWSGHQRIAMHGPSMLSWNVLCVKQKELGLYMSLPQLNLRWICQSYCGR